jgi:hypothetical protein
MITPAFNLTATERVLPRLSLDFSTANLDSRITFTRTGSTATVVGSNGLIQTAATDVPRFDHDPISLACKGLLIEDERTNIRTYSEDSTQWAASSGALTGSAIAAPDGVNNGTQFTPSTTLTRQGVNVVGALSYTAGLTYSMSVFVKSDGERYVQLALSTSTVFSVARANFDVIDGTVASGTGIRTIQPFKDGWYRLTWTIEAVGSFASANLFLNVVGASNTTRNAAYAGDGTDGIYLWGWQIEVASSPTSYIPTEATAVTRNADVALITGSNFSDWYSAGAGGVVVRVLPSTVSGTCPALQFDDTTADEVIALRGNTTNPELVIVDGGSPQAQIDAGTIAANTAYNLGAAWNTDDCAAAVNGGAAVTDTTATIPTVTQARLGSDGTSYLNGHLQTVRYWPQRIINAEVQAFSK